MCPRQSITTSFSNISIKTVRFRSNGLIFVPRKDIPKRIKMRFDNLPIDVVTQYSIRFKLWCLDCVCSVRFLDHQGSGVSQHSCAIGAFV
jgi:hypothetical protein